jgi:hypothetical protein
MTTLREAIEQTVAILGPEAPLCSGCVEEWTEALRILRAALAEQPAEQEPKTQGWQPIETAPKGRVLLVYYKNSLGNGRTMRARHYLPETLESDTTESGWADEGWYEESEAYEYLMPLEHDPTHWMPLPAGPDTAPQPPQQTAEWADLPPEEIKALVNLPGAGRPRTAIEMAYAVQAKLREKNGGGV